MNIIYRMKNEGRKSDKKESEKTQVYAQKPWLKMPLRIPSQYVFYSCLVELAKELQKADEFTRAVAGSKLALIAEEVSHSVKIRIEEHTCLALFVFDSSPLTNNLKEAQTLMSPLRSLFHQERRREGKGKKHSVLVFLNNLWGLGTEEE
jgi:hypothetical protein